MSKSNGKQREATATEPKTRPEGSHRQEATGSNRRGAESEARAKPQTGGNARQREATGMEPKSGTQGPILKDKAKTPKSKLCLVKKKLKTY